MDFQIYATGYSFYAGNNQNTIESGGTRAKNYLIAASSAGRSASIVNVSNNNKSDTLQIQANAKSISSPTDSDTKKNSNREIDDLTLSSNTNTFKYSIYGMGV